MMTTVIDLTHDGNILEAMESTCNDLHACEPCRKDLPELSSISSIASVQSEVLDGPEQQQLRVYLRVRPFSNAELNSGEDQGCIVLEDSETAVLHAPKGSASMKNSEKGIGQSMYKFSFTQIFGSEVGQAEVFDGTVRSPVQDFLQGKNSLLFSYGVTNAGKTHTIQGSAKDPGILPRALDIVFRHISGRQYALMDLRPYLGSSVQRLDADQLKTEKLQKAVLFSLLRESDAEPQRTSRSRSSSSSSVSSLCFSGISYDQTESSAEDLHVQYCVWVAYYEIYNEQVYDLLLPQNSKTKKRSSLRVCDESNGNSYVRDLRWVNIHNSDEACRVLRVGNKNRSAASTKMNQSSSRSHSIFTMKLLRIDGTDVQGISELSLCDLAGSERCNKTKTFGERLKEAGNINTSLLTLGKCIAALRSHNNGVKSSYVPFRESKLTRLFQGVFCGRGKAFMIVNINQCASTYDETLNVMKFSAVAQQVVQVLQPRSLESLAPRLVGRDGKPLVKNGVIDQQAVDDYLSEEELLDGADDEADMSILPQEELLGIIETLRTKLLAERRKNLVQEIQIRKEMGDAMLQQLMDSEEQHSRQMALLKQGYEEKLDNTFELYKDALKEHAYQCAVERLEEDYIPIEEYNTAQKELKTRLSEVEEKLRRSESGSTLGSPFSPTQECSTQTVHAESPAQDADAERSKRLYREKCAVEKLCCEKQELIVALESRISELNDTLQEAGESYMEKLSLVQTLQNKLTYQERETEHLQSDVTEKEAVLTSLREELAKLSQAPEETPRPRRGLLANIKDSVSSPRSGTLCRTLKRSVRTTPSLKKKPV
ncbi:kinesin-like protein KIF20A isoform X2 [Clupea harengus]|uniref:Kinesin-like protein n=1 Tax=Clupea harengus TaxID=7950 RepID=A0A6P8GKQ5_CLUHA|nr:kinesin-like protein KIF20A isoform X2 [Clupea harengus]